MFSVGLCSAIGTEIAQPLFSQIQTSGSFQTEAVQRRLVEGAAGGGAVAEEDRHHLVGAEHLGRDPGARAEHEVGADRAALAEHADLGVDEVDGAAALAADAAAGAPEEVGEQGDRGHALGQRVAKAAVRVEEVVVAPQGGDGAGLDRLLAEPGMPETAEAVLLDVAIEQQLERADS